MLDLIKKRRDKKRRDDRGSLVRRWRLLLYGIISIAAASGGVLLLLLLSGVISPGDRLAAELRGQLDGYEGRLSDYFSNTAGQGLYLSALAAKEVERTLAEHDTAFEDVSGRPDLIIDLERNTFDLLRTALLIADCSGAFIVFDATVNPSLPGGEFSRSGLYLKLANINVTKPVNPEILWTRGAHEIGLENKLIFHNKWEMEFSLPRDTFYQIIKKPGVDLAEQYCYSPVARLPGTWERIMVLLVPVAGKSGRIYGVCGFEISALFFKLMQPVPEGRRLTGLIAQKRGNEILSATGLEAGAADGYFAGLGEGVLRLAPEGGLTVFQLADGREFIGAYKELALSPLSQNDADPWVAAVFIPREDYRSDIYGQYLLIVSGYLVFLTLALALGWYVKRRCLDPLVKGISDMKSGVTGKTNIPEIDDLLEFLAGNDAGENGSGPDIDMSAFFEFKRNISTLSKAEKGVFDLYMEGCAAPEIADRLYVSINTVKSHNKNIYRKLNVTSRKALMVYAQMMKNTPK